MKKAIQFGAGNIGRGFIGELESLSGYHVTFADVVQPLVDSINAEKKYTVHITDVKSRDILITNVSAVNSNSDDLKREIAEAEVITTAVGLRILPFIAPALAAGLSYRFEQGITEPLNIIACENALLATSQLKKSVYEHLSSADAALADRYVGFADCSVDRIVPPIRSSNLDVSVEEFCEWNVDSKALKGDAPDIEGMNLVDNLLAYEERKLFTLNTAHAVIAYLGYHKRFPTINAAVADSDIFSFALGAVHESGEALCKEFGFDHTEHFHYIDTVMERFRNPYLKDDVTRVAREPIRKLGPNDRLVKPMETAFKHGLQFDSLMVGTAAALHYDYAQDPQAVQLQAMIASDGLSSVIEKVCGIHSESPVSKKIQEQYEMISNGTLI
jgi:mannitol-1-phosphate 5-dehydrogenase